MVIIIEIIHRSAIRELGQGVSLLLAHFCKMNCYRSLCISTNKQLISFQSCLAFRLSFNRERVRTHFFSLQMCAGNIALCSEQHIEHELCVDWA